MTTSDTSDTDSSPSPSPSASSSSYSWPSPPCSPSPATSSPAPNVPQFHRLCLDMLSPLPRYLLEPIVNRLCVRDVWRLWQTSRSVQTALEQCVWCHEVTLDEGSDGLLAVRMFAPGCVRRMRLGDSAFDRFIKSDRDDRLCRRAWERLMAHFAHVERLNVCSDKVLLSLPSPPCPTAAESGAEAAAVPGAAASRAEAIAAVLDSRSANSSWQSLWRPSSARNAQTCSSSSSPEFLTWPLTSHFAALRELECTVKLNEADQGQSGLLPLVSTLTSLTVCRGMLSPDAMKTVMWLPRLKRLALHDHVMLLLWLSADVFEWAASLESVEVVRYGVRGVWSVGLPFVNRNPAWLRTNDRDPAWLRTIDRDPAWLRRLRSATLLDVAVETLDLSALAELPVLHTLTVQAERVVWSLPPNPIDSTACAAAAAVGLAVSTGARGVARNVTTSAAPRAQHQPGTGAGSVAHPPASRYFPCLTTLHLTVRDGASVYFSMFPNVTCLKLIFPDVLSPVGTLASMPLLTSLEVRVGKVPSRPLNPSDLSRLRCLKEVKVDEKAFRHGIHLSALSHVASVALYGDMDEANDEIRPVRAERR